MKAVLFRNMSFSSIRIMLILLHFQVVKMFSGYVLASYNSQSIKISGRFIVCRLVWTRGEPSSRRKDKDWYNWVCTKTGKTWDSHLGLNKNRQATRTSWETLERTVTLLLHSIWTELCSLFPEECLNLYKLFPVQAAQPGSSGYFCEYLNPKILPPAEGSLNHKCFRAHRAFGGRQVYFLPLSSEPGLDGVRSDVVWPFSGCTYKHKDFVKQWALS